MGKGGGGGEEELLPRAGTVTQRAITRVGWWGSQGGSNCRRSLSNAVQSRGRSFKDSEGKYKRLFTRRKGGRMRANVKT